MGSFFESERKSGEKEGDHGGGDSCWYFCRWLLCWICLMWFNWSMVYEMNKLTYNSNENKGQYVLVCLLDGKMGHCLTVSDSNHLRFYSCYGYKGCNITRQIDCFYRISSWSTKNQTMRMRLRQEAVFDNFSTSSTESNELKKLMGWLKGASPKEIPAGSVTTFQLGQILPGDAVFLPFGSIFVEKALNAHSVTLKVADEYIWFRRQRWFPCAGGPSAGQASHWSFSRAKRDESRIWWFLCD